MVLEACLVCRAFGAFAVGFLTGGFSFVWAATGDTEAALETTLETALRAAVS